jgi:anti-sigma regulatory factor (Ser/Thr protein kinase)
VLPVADRGSGEQVSALVGKALAAWHLPEMVDEVELCARELWGNVVRHTSRPAAGGEEWTAQVALWYLLGERLRVEVSDRDDRMPVLGRAFPDTESLDGERVPEHVAEALLESGRGLGIVQRRADALSWSPLAQGGKRVWCEFSLGDTVVGPIR